MSNVEQVVTIFDEIFKGHCAKLQTIADVVDIELATALKANGIPWTDTMMRLANEFLGSNLGQELRLSLLFNLLMRDFDKDNIEEEDKGDRDD